MRDALVSRLPTSERSELEERLRRAVSAENFELAAILRDELRSMDS
jgi:protein-arginine kinase activator protein McsA